MQHCGWSSFTRASNNNDNLDLSTLDSNGSSQTTNTSFDFKMPCAQFLNANNAECDFSRSAAVMVFNGKICDAIEYLKQTSNLSSTCDKSIQDLEFISLNVIALALSAYITSANNEKGDSKDLLCIQMCSNLKNKLGDPYIKAIFTFLSKNPHEDNNFDEIIVSNFILISKSYNYLLFIE